MATKLTGRERAIKGFTDATGQPSAMGRAFLASLDFANADSEDDKAYAAAKQRLLDAAHALYLQRLGRSRWAGMSPAERKAVASAAAKKRWEKISPEKRSAIMRKVVRARWRGRS